MADRRLPVRAAPGHRADGQRGLPGDRDRDRQAGRAAGARRGGDLDQVRRSGAAARRDRRARRRGRDRPAAGDLRRAGQGGADRAADRGDPGGRGDDRRPALAPADDPLNLKHFIYELDVPVIVGGCATYTAALHLMRTGAAGVLVGFGGGSGQTTAAVLGVKVPMATAIADVAAARREYLDESGGRYVHVIADGGMTRSGDIAKALALGADAVMVGSPFARAAEAPGRGYHWGAEAHHPELPRGARLRVGTVGTLTQILHGPSTVADGSMNLVGALRRTMATSGYSDLKEFQRVEVAVTPGAAPGR